MHAASDHVATASHVFGAAIQGQRSEQQDSFRSIWLTAERAWLLIVADGMGGHAAGGMASRIAADSFVKAFSASRAAGVELRTALKAALDDANAQIAKAQVIAPEFAGMGTTLVAVYLSHKHLGWISVGDSPFWLLRNGTIERLNEDHSLRSVVADDATVSGNILRSVLNGEPIPLIDCQVPAQLLGAHDILLLASDGLLTLQENDIAAEVLQHASRGPEAVARSLLRAVQDRGKSKQDNCTVVVAIPPPESSVDKAAVQGTKNGNVLLMMVAAIVIGATAIGVWSWRF